MAPHARNAVGTQRRGRGVLRGGDGSDGGKAVDMRKSLFRDDAGRPEDGHDENARALQHVAQVRNVSVGEQEAEQVAEGRMGWRGWDGEGERACTRAAGGGAADPSTSTHPEARSS